MYELNAEQRAAAEFKEGIGIVVAIPGSGKTLTMTHRIANLVKEGIPPENILGITFTKNAALTMKKRLRTLLDDRASRVSLSTVHSFCYNVLKSEGRSFNLLLDYAKIVFIHRIMKRLKVKGLPIGLVIGEISLAKSNLIYPCQFIELYENDTTLVQIGHIYREYEKAKDKKQLVDFEDLLSDTHILLSENEAARNKYQEMYKHLLIDEYQDTNPIQLEIVKLLMNGFEDGSLFVVGDDSQCIYSFTGASVSNILNFKKMFPSAQEFRLTLNYRSTPQILEACSNLISHNKMKIDKKLKPHNGDGEKIVILEPYSEEEEGLFIAQEIRAIIERQQCKYSDIAILYRANFQSRAIEEMFLKHKIPYKIENGQNFFQRREIRALLDYLRVISNPLSDKGDLALLNILNIPNRYLGHRFKHDLEQYSHENKIHIYEALNEMSSTVAFERHNARKLVNFLSPLIDIAETLAPAEMIEYLRKALDYDKEITEYDTPMADDPKIANLDQLQLAASRFEKIEPFLQYAETFQDKKVSDNKKGVRLMTIHKSKGMEFPIVFLIGLVGGIMPISKGDIEEERRIVYVGISRASKLLYVSSPATYYGKLAKQSMFLGEMKHGEKQNVIFLT